MPALEFPLYLSVSGAGKDSGLRRTRGLSLAWGILQAMSSPSASLAALANLLDEAGQLALEHYGHTTYVLKDDGSLVTPADGMVEAFLGPRLQQFAPGAALWGEEEGHNAPTDQGLWLIDPIDGTSNYAFGFPLWGVTVGLYRDGEIQIGGMILPCLGDTIAAEKGGGAFRNGQEMAPIRPGPIKAWDLVGHGDVTTPSRHGIPGKTRHMGAFVVESYGFLTQSLRAMTTSGCRLYDAAGGIVAARELGAELRHLDGRPFRESDWVATGSPLDPMAFLPPDSGLLS
jgi:fructose-1,6-bisphosphatase/inositol monophosphatase family enzyme